MPTIIVVGDLHNRIEEPFFSVQQEFQDWFSKQDFNKPENTFIQLGDFYHDAKPNPRTIKQSINWLSNQIKCERKIIISGNRMHEFNRLKNSFAIETLEDVSDIILDNSPTVIDMNPSKRDVMVDGVHLLFLPYKHENMKEDYEKFFKSDFSNEYAYIFGHFANEPLYDSEFVDTSNYKGNLVLGHIHKRYGNYLGTPYSTRYDEQHKDNFIMIIDTETKKFKYVQVPIFFDYEDVPYPEKIDEDVLNKRIWTIVNAPSIKVADDYYKGLYPNIVIRNIETLEQERKTNLSDSLKLDKQNSIKEFFDEFKKKEKLNKDVSQIVEKYLVGA